MPSEVEASSTAPAGYFVVRRAVAAGMAAPLLILRLAALAQDEPRPIW